MGNTYLCKELLKYNTQFKRVFQLEYRLAQCPSPPIKDAFPTALIDAVAGYNYLVNVMGFHPSNILLSGDSVGGHLAINLVRYLISCVPSLPPPGAILLMSSGADFGGSHWSPESSLARNASIDYLSPFFVDGKIVRAFLGNISPAEADTDPWISPASKHLATPEGLFTDFPPTILVVGGAEMMLDAHRTLRDRMARDIGDRFTYLEVPDAMHIFMSFGPWHEPEASQTYGKVANWLSGVMPAHRGRSCLSSQSSPRADVAYSAYLDNCGLR